MLLATTDQWEDGMGGGGGSYRHGPMLRWARVRGATRAPRPPLAAESCSWLMPGWVSLVHVVSPPCGHQWAAEISLAEHSWTRPDRDQWWQITQRKVEEHYFQLLKSISCAVIYNCWSQVHWPVIESESVILVSMLDIAQWPGASEDEDEGGAGADGDDDGQPQTLGGGSGAHEERLDTITKKILTYIIQH